MEYRSRIIGLLRDRNFILTLALLLGVFLGQGANWTEPLVLPVLALVMMLSTTSVKGRLFRSPRGLLYPILTGVTMSYIVQGGSILLLIGLIPLEEALQTGFIILAAVPPAVGVIPFTGFLNGDVEFTLIGCLSCYLVAFIFTPLILFYFLGVSTDTQVKLFTTLVELIIIPLVLSRVLVKTSVASKLEPIKGTIINWCFFLVVYTVVGLNQEIFLSQPASLISAAIIALATTFLLGTIIDKVGLARRIDTKRVISMVLMGTSKNAGFAAGLALTLFSRKTALPSAIQTISMIAYIIYLDFRSQR
ncbi:MAG: bile acid:sodium symporter family protein [Candidatus Bathyarchaeia archaeon]